MSNATIVSPYVTAPVAGDVTRALAECASECAAAVARWLTDTTAQEQQAVDALKAARRRERLAARRSATCSMSAVPLCLHNPESLVRAAKALGYQTLERALGNPHSPSGVQPAARPLLLQRASGERLAIVRDEHDRLVVHTTGDVRQVHELVRQHTIDRAQEHFAAQGMSIQTRINQTGDLEIIARENPGKHPDGDARIAARVSDDGRVRLDVDGLRGRRCEEIAAQFTEAVGGTASAQKKKDAYFVLPGKRTKKRLEV